MSLPYQKHSQPSEAAAKAFERLAKTCRYRVFQYIRARPRVSDKDIREALQMNPNTERPRRVELEAAGLIRPDGEDPGATGRVLYVATGNEYPISPPKDFWRSRMREHRAIRPTPEEIGVAVRVMREVYRASPEDFPPEAVKVFTWLGKQGK